MEIFDKLKALMAEYPLAYDAIAILLIALAAWLANFAAKRILVHGLKKIFNAVFAADSEDKELIFAMASRLANIVPAIVLFLAPGFFPEINDMVTAGIQRFSIILIGIFVTICVNKLLDICELIYRKQPYAPSRPIKGYLQLAKIIVGIVAAILIISTLLNKSPLLWLSGLGAVTAVMMLVFQDTILSLVASIQLNSNNMIKIGDWIVMPSHNVDGFVIEVALHTVKVQNWDKTIVTVPTRKLIEESFTNWRGMFESGGRRIKRSLYIDQRTVRFLAEDEIKRLESFVLLNDYLDEKRTEISEWNAELAAEGAKPINARRITNLGTFRVYVEKYLRSNKAVNQNMILLVRLLEPGSTGIPLEIYCFTKSTQWIDYEKAQADIFDHLLAIMPAFGLRVFQDCSDIYQEASDVPSFIDDTFPQHHFIPPTYPSDMKRIKAIAKEVSRKEFS